VNENGDVSEEDGVTEPAPFDEIVTAVALPPKVFPLTVTGVAVPHIDCEVLARVTVGPLTQAQNTVKELPVVEHPAEFLTVML
jgi:hypothetical protein